MFQEEPKDWRELVGRVTSGPGGMQRITQTVGVQAITVKRWVQRISEPRAQNLRGLLSALPEHRERLLEFFAEEYDDFADLPPSSAFQDIPARFYLHILQICGTISHTQRHWSLANTIISQALGQLDPENLGMAITLVKCMQHTGHDKIYSLRQGVGQCTSPWPSNLEQHAMFLGAESLAGFAVATCRPYEIQDYREEPHASPGHQFEHERSAAAHPILYAGRIAGCLLVSSTEPHAFYHPSRTRLIADYAHLIALALDPEDFVVPADIELRVMPPHSEQKEAFSSFRQRIIDARSNQKSDIDAEQYVWEQLEDELIKQQERKYQRIRQTQQAE